MYPQGFVIDVLVIQVPLPQPIHDDLKYMPPYRPTHSRRCILPTFYQAHESSWRVFREIQQIPRQ